MNGSQLIGLDNVGGEIYDIHGYFHSLIVGQRIPRFWSVTATPVISYLRAILMRSQGFELVGSAFYLSISLPCMIHH